MTLIFNVVDSIVRHRFIYIIYRRYVNCRWSIMQLKKKIPDLFNKKFRKVSNTLKQDRQRMCKLRVCST